MKTVACVALIATATAFAAGKDADAKRAPASDDQQSLEGLTYVGCKPAYPMYKDKEAYKNNCVTAPITVRIPGGFAPRVNSACEKGYHVVVSSTPVMGSCLPPGVVEL